MKKLGQFVVVIALVALAIPIVQYRTLSPCGMVKEELVNRARAQTESLSDRGREEAEQFGEDVGRLAEEIGGAVEDVATSVAAGLAEARVEQMSVGECVKELWTLKTGRKS